jgi:hypothetical protein
LADILRAVTTKFAGWHVVCGTEDEQQENIPENIMTAYTPTAAEVALEALEVGLERVTAATKEVPLAAKTALMLVVGPLSGLAFVFALPVIGLTLIAYYAAKLLAARWAAVARHVRNMALFLAAPFIGLAYMLALPFVGLGVLAYYGVKAARR